MASSKLTDRTELTTAPASDDVLHIVDISDTTGSAAGTSKKIKVSNLVSAGGVTAVTGTAPIASSGGSTPAISITAATTSAAGSMSGSDKTKLNGIATGAEVNVNADWNASSGDAQILNKPTIPAAQVNSDWNSSSGVSEILNKPTIPAAQVNSDWNSTSGVSEILNKPNLNVLDGVILEYTTRTAAFSNGAHEGEVLKINSDSLSYGKVYQLLSTGWAGTLASSAARSVGLLGWALGTNSGTNGLFHKGILESSLFSFTAGDTLYLDPTNEGLLTATIPTTSTHVVRVMGYAIASNRIYFNPSPTFIQID